MKPGDIIKIKLGGDVQEAKVIDCRNKKTIWVEVLWAKTRIHALTPAEKKKVAESPISMEGLSEQEQALALLAQRGKKLVHQRGNKRIKIPRARVVDAEPFKPQVPKSVSKRLAIQTQERNQSMKVVHEKNYGPQPSKTQSSMKTAEAPMQTSPSDEKVKQEASEPRQLSKLEQMKARIAEKKEAPFSVNPETKKLNDSSKAITS